MNHKKIASVWIGILMIGVLSLSGCGKSKNGWAAKEASVTPTATTPAKAENVSQQWVYIHDRGNLAMVFYKDGTALYNGEKYKSYEEGEEKIRLTSEDGTVTDIRYFDETTKDGEKRRTIYRITDYKLTPSSLMGDSPVIGYWIVPEKNWSYQFTEKGTFLEDGVLPGYYYVNDDGTIRLNYEGNLPETVFYYSVHDDVMTIEYPWVMAEMP
ncbi:MAG: hypothetical protein J5795_00300 [Lachnospiraceae bacterium]|nr:hypothetical protein [Lachnospiraceae bacterium]